MVEIERLLHRRTDLSTFLVHLTRHGADSTARDNLLSIAKSLTLEARTPLGPAAHLEQHLAGSEATQKVVCFTETPLEHTWMLLEDIQNRAIQFQPYGLVLTKTTARKAHVNPVWYSDIAARGRDWPITAINELVADALARSTAEDGSVDGEALGRERILRVTPYFEQMGPTNSGTRKEFWWEREWRRVGDYYLSFPSRIVAFLAPEDDHETFRRDLYAVDDAWERNNRPVLDPTWGLERMIVALARIDPDHWGPFPDAY